MAALLEYFNKPILTVDAKVEKGAMRLIVGILDM